MARRMAIIVIVAGCLLLPSSLHAQGDPYVHGDQQHGLLPALFSFKRSGHPGRTQYGGTTAAGQPVSYATPGTAVPGTPYYGGDGIVTTRIPPQQDWVAPTPLEATIEHAFHGSYYRVEYLHWNIQRPGNVLLGSQPLSVRDPSRPFPIFDNQIPANQIGTGVVPNLSEIGLRGNNGIRGTWGIETSFGNIEANYFVLEQADDVTSVGDLRPQVERTLETDTDTDIFELSIGPGQFAGTSLRLNGNPSNIIELYNRSFTARYESDIMGAEVLMRFADIVHLGFPLGMNIQPIIGFRFLQVHEKLGQVGVFEDITGQAPLLTSRIDSDTNNNLFGPTIGMRYELPHPWFTLGVEPKFTLASNSNRARVATRQFRLAADPTVVTKDRSTYFSPIGEVQAYARIRLSDSIRMTIGYSYMFISKLTRPHDNIFYNDNGIFPTPPGVVLKSKSTDLRVQGLTLGIEIDLP